MSKMTSIYLVLWCNTSKPNDRKYFIEIILKVQSIQLLGKQINKTLSGGNNLYLSIRDDVYLILYWLFYVYNKLILLLKLFMLL